MKITIYGATGDLGSECLKQSLAAGHEVTALVRTPSKLPHGKGEHLRIIEGDALNAEDVAKSIDDDTDAILFAVGVDKHSPHDLCTDVTRHILQRIKGTQTKLVWCGGGSNFRDEDQITFGAIFVKKFAEIFLVKRHHDKENQLALLDEHQDINWVGLRPLQMKKGHQKPYRVGFHRFSGMSSIHFSDCADAMLAMIEDDTWLRRVPIIQY